MQREIYQAAPQLYIKKKMLKKNVKIILYKHVPHFRAILIHLRFLYFLQLISTNAYDTIGCKSQRLKRTTGRAKKVSQNLLFNRNKRSYYTATINRAKLYFSRPIILQHCH